MRVRVLDASALAGALLDASRYAAVVDVLDDEECEAVTPHLADVEVLSVLRRVARSGRVPLGRVETAVELLAELPLRRFDHGPLLARAFALREYFSAHDAVYVALAEGMAAPLVTAHARLARAVRAWTAVEVVEVPAES